MFGISWTTWNKFQTYCFSFDRGATLALLPVVKKVNSSLLPQLPVRRVTLVPSVVLLMLALDAACFQDFSHACMYFMYL